MIKNIMKADKASVILKACEMFISELTMRSRNHGKAKTLQKTNDIAVAVARTNTFDFLVDIVPHEKMTYYSHAFQFLIKEGFGIHIEHSVVLNLDIL
ncbi:nuclear transcription factor Y subunit C-9-like protein, partial [Trifolium pratense]